MTANFNLPKINLPLKTNFIIAFLLLTFLLWGAHELTHHLVAGVICGEFGYLTFNKFWQKNCYPAELIAVAAGPLLSYALMWTGMFLVLKSKKYSLLGLALIFATGPIARLFSGFTRGDESNFGFVGTLFSLLLTLPPLIIAYQTIANKKRFFVFLYFFLALPFFLVLPFIFLDNWLVIPMIKMGQKTGIFPLPLVSGIPLIIIFFYTLAATIFFSKYLNYFFPQRNLKAKHEK